MPDPTRRTISASQVAGLFGQSPWVTPYMLHRWVEGVTIDKPGDGRMRIGTLLQPVILQLAAEELRLDVTENADDEYQRHPDPGVPLGATVDAVVTCPTRGRGIVEAKNHDWLQWRRTYGFDETNTCLYAPAHEEIQVQTQMLVTGAKWGVIATLVGGNQLQLLHRAPDPEVHARIIERVRTFYADVASGRGPDPSAPADLDVVRRLCPRLVPEPPEDLRCEAAGEDIDEWGEAYNAAALRRRAGAAEEAVAKANLLDACEAWGWPAVMLCPRGTLRVSKSKAGAVRVVYKPQEESA